MRILIAAAALMIVPNIATAQICGINTPPAEMSTGNGFGSTAGAYFPGQTHVTPSMRAQKLRWAVALREEALALQKSDGGVLSDEHRAYILRRAKKIYSYQL